jgi:hypothetical protein
VSSPVITLILDAKNLASAQLKGLQRDLKGAETSAEKTSAAMSRGSMVAKGILAAGIAGAGYAAVRYIGDSVDAFREEQVGVERLGASLRANVSDWDGSTDAIERQISAMVRTTGFGDGEMRDSLQALVGSTHDVDKAFRLMGAAQDLARKRGISLVDASTALIKVEGGQYRALKELGIQLPKNASAEEALAAVQKVAGGQMAAYMATSAGKAEVLKNRMEDLQEEVGARVTPAIETATEALLELMDVLEGSPLPTHFTPSVYKSTDALGFLGDSISNVTDALTPWDGYTSAAADRMNEMGAAIGEAAKSADTGSERIMAAMEVVRVAAEDTGPAVYHEMAGVMGLTAQAIRDGASEVAQAWRAAREQANTELDNADQIIINNAEITVQKKIQMDKKATAAQKAEARIRERALKADNVMLRKEMQLLANKGYVYGQGFTMGFVRGLVKDVDRVGESARTISKTVKQYLQVHSPSELGPFSEMGGPGGWGQRFGELWADGLAGSAGAAGGASDAWASGLAMPGGSASGVGLGVSRLSGGGAGGGGAGGGGGSGGVTLVVNSTYPPTQAQIAGWADTLDREFRSRFARYSPASSRA